MAEDERHAGRMCREVRAHLPRYVAGELTRWRGRLLELHLRRCAACAEELRLQRDIAESLQELGEADRARLTAPPEGLLESLLERAEHPGARGRAAVPARGAVSGARPGLSAALLLAGAAAGTGAGYAAWRAARAVGRRVGRARPGR